MNKLNRYAFVALFLFSTSIAHSGYLENKAFERLLINEKEIILQRELPETCANTVVSQDMRKRFFESTTCNTTNQIREVIISDEIPTMIETTPSQTKKLEESPHPSKAETESYPATEEET